MNSGIQTVVCVLFCQRDLQRRAELGPLPATQRAFVCLGRFRERRRPAGITSGFAAKPPASGRTEGFITEKNIVSEKQTEETVKVHKILKKMVFTIFLDVYLTSVGKQHDQSPKYQ